MLWDKLKDLAFEIDEVTTSVDAIAISPEFERRTTTIRIAGGSAEGLGEDVAVCRAAGVYYVRVGRTRVWLDAASWKRLQQTPVPVPLP